MPTTTLSPPSDASLYVYVDGVHVARIDLSDHIETLRQTVQRWDRAHRQPIADSTTERQRVIDLSDWP
jgi:hypothetical protein